MKIQGTYLDKLINEGSVKEIPPETVIIKVDDVLDDLNDHENYEKAGKVSRPIFNHCFIEGYIDGLEDIAAYGYIGIGTSHVEARDVKRLLNGAVWQFIKKHPDAHKIDTDNIFHGAPITDVGIFTRTNRESLPDWIMLFDYDGRFVDYALVTRDGKLDKDSDFFKLMVDFPVSIAVRTFELFHTKQEIEIRMIEPPKNYVKREIRKKGKEPSPYFQIIKIDKSAKRVGMRGLGLSSRKAIHIRRGHFRVVTNHPIEHLNGTYWIEATTVGSKGVQIAKGYTVKLKS